jgi:acyl-CoA thioester hydrolase
MNKSFELYRNIVMPAHCDLYGHMNVRHYAAMFDDAGFHVLGAAGVSLTDLQARGLGTVMATVTIDFHHEIKAGQLVLITGAIVRVGGKSFTHHLELFEMDSMTLCASQSAVEVCFDTAARKAVTFPADVKAKLEAAVSD